MKQFLFLAVAVWLAAGWTAAQDSNGAGRPSEADLFGGGPAAAPATSKAKAGERGPGAPASASAVGVTEEGFQIGGTLSNEADFYIANGVPLDQNTASNPNILFLYMDAKLENDSRVFLRTRTFYDPTGLSSGNPGLATYTNPYGFGLGTSDNLGTTLQELRISTNIAHKVFFTLGRQKVKYGAAHFFNPTDFLNAQPFNFFLPTDERTGVDMIKAQFPSGSANLYAAGVFGNPGTGNSSGGYFRGELPYDGIAGDLLGAGEISLSGWFPKGQPGRAGFDLSQAVGDFDVYVEGAAGQDTVGDWKDAVSAGFTWQVRYADRQPNTVTFNGEYFQAGALAEYGVFAVDLGGPWGMDDITFVGTNLYNFNDGSGLSRLDTVCQFTDRLSGRVYLSGHWGPVGGTFYLPGQVAETGARLDVNF